MLRKSALSIITILVYVSFCHDVAGSAIKRYVYPIEISGKVLDNDGKLFTEQAELNINVSITSIDYNDPHYSQEEENSKYNILVKTGTFFWRGEGDSLIIEATKEGYYSTRVNIKHSGQIKAIKKDDILIYLIPKGNPVKLDYVESAEFPDVDDKESGGKKCGWSFNKLWYFPANEDNTVLLTRSYDEKGRMVYTIKEPGGFVAFSGFPQFESKPNERVAQLNFMTKAPESGYVQSVCPEQDGYCFYFKTPDGKYGKIRLGWSFDYYINLSGSRDLEAGEVKELGPVNPKEKEWEDKWSK